MTTPKTNPEFDNFTGFMDKLAKVPHSELKAKLDAEKQTKRRASPPEKGIGRRRKGRQVKQPHVALLVALAVLCSSAMSHAVKHDVVWQSAKLISFDAQQGSDDYTYQSQVPSSTNNTAPPTTVTNVGSTSYVDYHIVLDNGKMLYFGTWRLVFRWQKDPHFTENEMVKYDLDGDKLTVIDDAGKQIKMKLIKRRIKE